MKTEPNLDFLGDNANDIIDWFDANYNESKDECLRLIIKAQIDYPFTARELMDGCREFRKVSTDGLAIHIKKLGLMCNLGVSAEIAGIKLREAIQNKM